MPQNRPKVLTAEEIAQRREQARLRHILRNSEIKTSSSDSEPSVNMVSSEINKPETPEFTQNENDIMFIAFGRIYSGTIRRGQKMYVLGPKHNPSKITDQVCFLSMLFMYNEKYIYDSNCIVFRIIVLMKHVLWLL